MSKKKATEFQRKEIEENKVDIGCAVLPTWFSCSLPAKKKNFGKKRARWRESQMGSFYLFVFTSSA